MTISQREFIRAIHSRTARVAVGASTARGQGVPGVVAAAREALRDLNLAVFGVARLSMFEQRLDAATRDVQSRLPASARTWGLARKVLNIFLRDCAYNVYLRDRYRLDRSEPLLELPLDSQTAKGLHQEAAQLPQWPGVCRLTPVVSGAYQEAAQQIAGRHGLDRVHLDTYWWSLERD